MDNYKVLHIWFEDEVPPRIESQLPELIANRNYLKLYDWFQSCQCEEHVCTKEAVAHQEYRNREQIKSYLILENYYVAIRYWPSGRADSLTLEMDFNDSIVNEILWGLEEHQERFSHKAAYLAYLISETDHLETLLSADRYSYMEVYSVAHRILQVLPSIIERVKREVHDPSLPLYQGRVKWSLPLTQLAILFGLFINEGAISKDQKQEEICRFIHSNFCLGNNQPPALANLHRCFSLKNHRAGEIRAVIDLGKKLFQTLKKVDARPSIYFTKA